MRIYRAAENTFWWAWLVAMSILGGLFFESWMNWHVPNIMLFVIISLALALLTSGLTLMIWDTVRAIRDVFSAIARFARKIMPVLA